MNQAVRQDRITDNVASARVDARAQAGAAAAAMPYLPAVTSPWAPADVDPAALVWAETVEGGNYTHRVLARGVRVRLEDIEGDANAHVVLFSAERPWERLNVADTVKIPWQAYLGEGHPLLSGDGRVLATVARDTSGHHDAFCGTSTAAANEQRYGASAPQSRTPAGRELLRLAAMKNGLEARDLPPSISFFQGVRVEGDGTTAFTGSAGPGHVVELVAEMPLILLLANVPHPLDPRPDYTVTPLRVHAWRDRATEPGDPGFDRTPESHRAYLNTLDYLTARGIA